MHNRFYLTLMILFNAVPLYGLYAWGWQAFELIFLYWFENLVIGVFTLWRFIARPYEHPMELVMPLFFAPFFLFHYGMFCLVHGSFVFALFGPGSELGSGLFAPLQSIPAMLTRDHLATAAVALILLQLVDWVRDIREHGLGSDNIRELMTRPYRRIVVLHLTILGSGFLLMAMDEPLAGLVMLVLMKTGFDVYHWRKDEAPEEQKNGDTDLLSPEILRQMEEKLPEPMVKVNGKEIRYESFQAMRDSKHFRMLAGVLRLMGKGRELRAMNAYLDRRIAEESAP